jgi:hypothetical protein
MSGKIFINYRRGDEPGFTQALLSRLEAAFPSERLFIDIDNIPPGVDFVRQLDMQVAECDILLAVIGKNWLDAKDEHGNRRLDNPYDFVRSEIESALKQEKKVIPILVNEARMPHSNQLPESIRPLATRNAVRLTHERFRADVDGLIKALHQVVPERRKYSRRAAVGLSIFLAVGVSSLGTWFATRWQTNDQTLVTLSGASAKVVGNWSWFNPVGSEVKISADGKIIHLVHGAQTDVGNWIPLNSEGLIQINWITGWSDQWQLSPDGNSMTGKNQNGSMGPVYRK